MNFIISSTASYIDNKVSTRHDVTFKQFVDLISKPKLITNSFSKFESYVIIPASMVSTDVQYDRSELYTETTKNSKSEIVERNFVRLYNREELVADVWADSKALRKNITNMKAMSMLAVDFDDIEEPGEIHRVHDILTKYNINHVLYQTPSYGTVKNGKIRYNFRTFIPLDIEIPKSMWQYVSTYLLIEMERMLYPESKASVLELREWMSKKDLRIIKDISTNQPTRHQMYPYTRDLSSEFIFISHTSGTNLSTWEARKMAFSLHKEDDQHKESIETRKSKAKESFTGGEIDLGKNVLGQIVWEEFDLGSFIHTAGLDLDYNSSGKWVGRCPHESTHNSASGPKDFIIIETGEIPVVSCSHASCRLHGQGATTRLFTEYHNCIDSNYIKHSFKLTDATDLSSPITEITSSKIEDRIKTEYGDIEGAFKKESKHRLIIGQTGVGKSTIIAKRTATSEGYVLILCSTKSEIEQMYATITNYGIDKSEIHCLTSEHSSIPPNKRIIIAHYHYTLRRGHSPDMYKLVDWAIENKPTVFADEIDTYVQIAFNQLELSTRYSKVKDTDLYIKIDKCRSRACNRMVCDKCIHHNLTWKDYEAGQPIFKFHNKANSHAFTDPDRINLDRITSVNSVVDSVTIKSTKLHTLTYDSLHINYGDVDSPISFDRDNKYYVDDIIGTSQYSFKVRTNSDLRDNMMDLYSNLCDKYKASNRDNYSEESMTEWVNKEINKTISYPYHTCGTEILCYLDTKGMQKIINASSSFTALTGTISPYQKNTITKLCHNDLYVYEVESPKDENGKLLFQPIKKLLVMVVNDSINIPHNYMQIVDSTITKNINGVKIHKTLLVTETKNELDKLKESDAIHHFAFFDPDSKGVRISEHMRHGNWNILVTHKRSSLTRGINLGEYSTVYYDYQANKSMNSYNYGETTDIIEARSLEHISLTIQGCGRINRKPIINGTLSDEAPYKVMIIYNAYESDIDNKPIDVTAKIINMIHSQYDSRCDEVHTEIITKFYDESDLVRILTHAQKTFIESGHVDILLPSIPETMLQSKWKDFRDSHVMKKLFTQEEFEHAKKIASYKKRLEEYKQTMGHIEDKYKRRQSVKWSRLKLSVPQELMKEFKLFFEN